jgi:hypothetical protein
MGELHSSVFFWATLEPRPRVESWRYSSAKFIDGEIDYNGAVDIDGEDIMMRGPLGPLGPTGFAGPPGVNMVLPPLEEREPKNDQSVIAVYLAWDFDCFWKIKNITWPRDTLLISLKNVRDPDKKLTDDGTNLMEETEKLVTTHREAIRFLTGLLASKLRQNGVTLQSGNEIFNFILPESVYMKVTRAVLLVPWKSQLGEILSADPNKRL